jgi:hypothetical protein
MGSPGTDGEPFLCKKSVSHYGKEVRRTQIYPPLSHLEECLEQTITHSIKDKKRRREDK